MPSTAVKERLAGDIALWAADGLVDAKTLTVLRARYDAPGFGWASLIKTAGMAGGVVTALGLLGLLSAIAHSELLGALLALGVGALGFWAGLKLSLDPLARSPSTAKVILQLGFLFFAGSIAVLAQALGADESSTLLVTGLVGLPVTLFLAYRFRNAFLLVVGTLGLLHWVGSWSRMVGRSSYEFDVQDPKAMILVAAAVVGVGIWHERDEALRQQTPRFSEGYQAVGLVYLNLSLLILTIYPREGVLPWIGLMAAAGIGQVVLGAYLKNGLITAFGVVSLALNLFTRFSERFWSELDAGLFFLAGGALMFAFAVGCERLWRALAQEGSA